MSQTSAAGSGAISPNPADDYKKATEVVDNVEDQIQTLCDSLKAMAQEKDPNKKDTGYTLATGLLMAVLETLMPAIFKQSAAENDCNTWVAQKIEKVRKLYADTKQACVSFDTYTAPSELTDDSTPPVHMQQGWKFDKTAPGFNGRSLGLLDDKGQPVYDSQGQRVYFNIINGSTYRVNANIGYFFAGDLPNVVLGGTISSLKNSSPPPDYVSGITVGGVAPPMSNLAQHLLDAGVGATVDMMKAIDDTVGEIQQFLPQTPLLASNPDMLSTIDNAFNTILKCPGNDLVSTVNAASMHFHDTGDSSLGHLVNNDQQYKDYLDSADQGFDLLAGQTNAVSQSLQAVASQQASVAQTLLTTHKKLLDGQAAQENIITQNMR